ncbi:Hypothetical predicted protein [Pelobates cultripes]|uniref:Uncharacterized protein n=1 Tax=Pelobates cultripes TaxID=61616 RepID=A0AAD1T629_PELCU|nr:Hypothetical predicted protein [Pelobates cultripes]
MGKNKRLTAAGPPGATPARQTPGPMDEFLSVPPDLRGSGDPSMQTPSSPGSSVMGSAQDSPAVGTLSQISADLAAISASMLTRRDKTEMVAELRAIIREEVAAVRNDLAALEQRVDTLEETQLQAAQHQQAADLATTRQGNILLDLRRLQAKIGNIWHVIRWPNDVPRFLRTAGLPEVPVPNWILDNPPARSTGPSDAAHNLRPRPGTPRRRGGPEGPEE